MPRFIGTAAYGLEAILMVIPVARSLRHPAHAANIVGWGTATYAVFTTVFGVVAYLYGFGSCNAPGNGTMVTECLPSGTVSSIVRWALASTLVIGCVAALTDDRRRNHVDEVALLHAWKPSLEQARVRVRACMML